MAELSPMAKKINKILKDESRFVVKSLGTMIAITFQSSFYEFLKVATSDDALMRRVYYGILTLAVGPLFWWLMQIMRTKVKALPQDDSSTLMFLDWLTLTSSIIHMNKAWAFKSLVTAEFGKFMPKAFATKFGIEAAILLLVGYGAFKLRNAVFGEAKESIDKPPASGFTIPHAYALNLYAAFPNVTGFYVNMTLGLWWTSLMVACGLEVYMKNNAWILIMTKVVYFFLVSVLVKVALIYMDGKNKINPKDEGAGVVAVNAKPTEKTTIEKSLYLAYSWALAYALNLFIFDDIRGCEYANPREAGQPPFPRYCGVINNFEYSCGITVVFAVMTAANALTTEGTWWTHYERKLHKAAFPTLCGWAWASFVYARLMALKKDLDTFEHGDYAVPVFYFGTWFFLYVGGTCLYNLYMCFYRDIHLEGMAVEQDDDKQALLSR